MSVQTEQGTCVKICVTASLTRYHVLDAKAITKLDVVSGFFYFYK